ncbi:hypothetical protein LJC59_04975 [Desulfovibrio sp. OttesenSCG-928-A18]|nr:hypothetical protein [Desulfovibrio sp. OttesenSCG-928-A18]
MRGIVRSLVVSVWFMALTFPILVIRVAQDGSLVWRWTNALFLGLGIFLLSFVWRALLVVKGISSREEADLDWLFAFFEQPRRRDVCIGLCILALSLAPLLAAPWQQAADALAHWWDYLGSTPFSTMYEHLGQWVGGIFSADSPKKASTPAPSFPFLPIFFSLALALFGLNAGRRCFTGRREQWQERITSAVRSVAEPGLRRNLTVLAVICLLLPLPFVFDVYRVNVMSSAFIWIMLGLGLNIVVGQAGLLVLGYVAFYAVGAYTYAVFNASFGGELVGFWMLLPVGGLFAAIAGILLSLPVLRLRGDYLAIVTLGFGEIVRVTLEGGSVSLAPVAWFISLFTDAQLPAWLTTEVNLGGPAGIGGIPYPTLFGHQFSMHGSIQLVYYIAMSMALVTMVAVARLRDSRIGRSWIALREDEIACEAMGINKVGAKLSAFALGACWAGFGGVLFAAKTTFINPSSFTFMESALILSVVVLGGLGSILGVVLGACVLILLPEYLRSFDQYRMLIFGASMVLMMVFRPQGLITPKAKKRVIAGVNNGQGPDAGPRLRARAKEPS